jgi:hypothetical protein
LRKIFVSAKKISKLLKTIRILLKKITGKMKLIVATLLVMFVLTTNGTNEKVQWECPDCPTVFSYSNYVPKDKNPNRLSTKQLHQQKCKNRKKKIQERIAEEEKNELRQIAEENREDVVESTQEDGSNYKGGELTKHFVKFVDLGTETLQEGGKLTQQLVTSIFGKLISREPQTEFLEEHSEYCDKREQINGSIETKGILFDDIVGKSEVIGKEKNISENIQTRWCTYDQQKLTQEVLA